MEFGIISLSAIFWTIIQCSYQTEHADAFTMITLHGIYFKKI